MKTELYIKNMVCDRCIMVVEETVKSIPIALDSIEMGKVIVELDEAEKPSKLIALDTALKTHGFSLINDYEAEMTEQVKVHLIKLLEFLPLQINQKLSGYLSTQLHHDYSKISKIFSQTVGVTIEKYFIKLKIEKVKELIQTSNLNFTEISQQLDYSNVNHLSNQFKKECGINLSAYKSGDMNSRTSIDQIV